MKWIMWVFMLVCNLIIPVVMIVFGRKFVEHPPETINGTYGYRTTMSMKNHDTWKFAHWACGDLWQKVGKVMVPFVVLGQALTLLCPTMESMCLWSMVPTTAEIIVMAATIVPVERALKRNFDENGSKR